MRDMLTLLHYASTPLYFLLQRGNYPSSFRSVMNISAPPLPIEYQKNEVPLFVVCEKLGKLMKFPPYFFNGLEITPRIYLSK